MEAIILAGGLGLRLKSVNPDLPKPMAVINGRPFLQYLLDYLKRYGATRIILSVGYKNEIIKNFFGNEYRGMKVVYSIEDKPLGTGGGLKKAATMAKNRYVMAMNGDSYFNLNVEKMMNFHNTTNSDLTIALKPMQNCERYGVVKIDENFRVIEFAEKKHALKGNTNGGVYIFRKDMFNKYSLPDCFSFENDFLMKAELSMYGFVSDSYFIDIGIPEDFERAQNEIMEKI